MKLVELHVERLPGVTPGFRLEGLESGINLLTGPNASGKSSVMRAVFALLYEEVSRGQGVVLQGVFEHGGSRFRVERVGDQLRWLIGGREVDPLPLPDRRLLPCYAFRLEELTAAGEADEEIAARIELEMSGGFDLPALARELQVRPRLGQSEQQALRRANEELMTARRHTAELRRREEGLHELRGLVRRCEAAVREAGDLQLALELHDLLYRQRDLEAQRDQLPPGLERLRGDEREGQGRLQGRLSEAEDSLRQAERARREAESELKATGLPEGGPAPTAVREARAVAARLLALEAEAGRVRLEAARARAAAAEAAAALGSRRPQLPLQLGPQELHEVEAGLADKRVLEERRLRLEARARSSGDKEAVVLDLEQLRSARKELLAWSRQGAPLTGPQAALALLALLAPFLPALLATVATPPQLELIATRLDFLPLRVAPAEPLPPLLAALFFGGIAVLLLPAWVRRRARRAAYVGSGAPLPERWRMREVLAQLETLERLIAQGEQQEQERLRQEDARRDLELLRPQLARLDDSLQRQAARVGYDPQRLDASLGRWLALAREYDRAVGSVRDASLELEALEREFEERRSSLTAFLVRFGQSAKRAAERDHLGPSAPPATGADAGALALAAHLDELESRLERAGRAREAIAAAQRDAKRWDEEATRARKAIDDLYEDAGLAEAPADERHHELDLRLAALPRWRELNEALSELAPLRGRFVERLRERPDLMALVEQGDEQRLREALASAQSLAGRLQEYLREITQVETLVGRAAGERALQRAAAARGRAVDELQDRYREALEAEAFTFLLERVTAEHQRSSQPEELRLAAAYFARFTRNRFELRFEPGSTSRFAGFDNAAGEGRQLQELSSGTRAQLLLALRLAHTAGAERGRAALPLFLDEALTTADAERYQAVVDSLCLLADEGRQIFYLTARSDETVFWSRNGRSPNPIDIAVARGMSERAVREEAALVLDHQPAVPAPGAMRPEEYGVLLGVPTVDPWEPVEAIHLFHLLRDDLELLHGLLQSGVEKLGVLRSFILSDGGQIALGEEERLRLEQYCHAAAAWLESWRLGRGRPVDRRVLLDSRCVSERFLEDVDALCQEVGGDARRLLGRLADRAVRGFRERSRLELSEWLAQHGYLDEREPLTREERLLEVQSALAQSAPLAGQRGGLQFMNLAGRLVDQLERALEVPSAVAPR